MDDDSAAVDPPPATATDPSVDANSSRGPLRTAWAEHRPYVAFSAALFALGVLLGAALAASGVDVLTLITEATGENPFGDLQEQELTPWFFVANNSIPFVAAIAGAITLGLFTVYIMVFNGIVVGNVGWFAANEVGVDFLLVGILPHGIFELPALFVAAGVGFRLLHRAGQRILGRRDSFVSKAYLLRTALLVLVAWLALLLAAVVEATVTGALLDALFTDRIGEGAAAANGTAASVAALVAGR